MKKTLRNSFIAVLAAALLIPAGLAASADTADLPVGANRGSWNHEEGTNVYSTRCDAPDPQFSSYVLGNTDKEVTVTAAMEVGLQHGLMFGITDCNENGKIAQSDDQYYLVILTTNADETKGQLGIARNDKAWPTEGSIKYDIPYAKGTMVDLKVSYSKGQITVYVNDQKIAEYTDENPFEGQGYGLASKARYNDDYSVSYTVKSVTEKTASTAVTEISSAADFADISKNLSGSYVLTQDITLTEGLSKENESAVFTGTFDGQGHTITFNCSDTNWRNGIFCTAGGDGCIIQNLTVKGTVTTKNNSSGGVVGTAKGQITFENITSEISITSECDADGSGGVGGILGVNEGCTVTFKNCTSKATIVGRRCAGGFIGMVRNGGAKEIFENCVFSGNVRCDSEWSDGRAAGGFIGIMHKNTNDEVAVSFKECASNGTVTGDYVLASAWVGSYARFGHPDQVPSYERCTQCAKVYHNGLEITKVSDTRLMEGMDRQTSGRLTFDATAKTVSVNSDMAMNADTLAAKVAAGAKVYVGGVLDEKAEITCEGRNMKVVSKDPTVQSGKLVTVVVVFADGSVTTLSQSKEALGSDRMISFDANGANASSKDITVNMNAERTTSPTPSSPKTGSAIIGFEVIALLSLAVAAVVSKKRIFH